MRILILGAGSTGGYFGGRLAQAGIDVTFLVRPQRAAQLRRDGLVIHSPLGDAALPVAHVTADALPALARERPFDWVMLSCKACDLDNSIDAIASAVGARTTVLPILNGLRHYAALDARFGRDAVLGGLCHIPVTRDHDGAILHLGKLARIVFGERGSSVISTRVVALADIFAAAGIEHVAASHINQEQWVKYTFLTALAAANCLMRADVGHIVATDDGAALMRALYAECLAVAACVGHSIPPQEQAVALDELTQSGSSLKASMLRDLEAGQRVEAEHIVGDMLERARAANQSVPLLQAAYCHLQVFEAQLRASR
ncbi:MAG: 2-dehydropantoate 2-reductase [Gallionellaceae bacterium]|nr:2-dehydropantoate 2-reductase [Gallionellaceae bacterium]